MNTSDKTLLWDRVWKQKTTVPYAMNGHIMGTECFISARNMQNSNGTWTAGGVYGPMTGGYASWENSGSGISISSSGS